MAEEIDFENRHFLNFKSHLILTLTWDDLESHIFVNVSSTLFGLWLHWVWLWTYLRTDVGLRTDGHFYRVY